MMAAIKKSIMIIAPVALYSFTSLATFATIDATQPDMGENAGFFTYVFLYLGGLLVPIAFFFMTLTIKTMVMDRPRRLIKTLYHNLTTIWLTRSYLSHGLPLLICLFVFILMFSPMKTLIPALHPYGDWDQLLHQLDQIIHFGVDPWRITHAIFPWPIETFIINVLYHLWFFVLYLVFVLMAFECRDERLRQTYFLSFFLSWIINGTIFAIIFSSVGPCYYDVFFGLDKGPYTELIARLKEIDSHHYPVWALQVQDMLWGFYQNKAFFLGSGISAMPSLHISVALIQALAAYRVNKLYGRILLVFFFVILIGSVHLGWHYAVDGYFSVVTTLLLWFCCKQIAAKFVKA